MFCLPGITYRSSMRLPVTDTIPTGSGSRTMKILLDHKDGFVTMAKLLLKKEVIFAEDIEKILGPKVKPDEEPLAEEEPKPVADE